MVRKASEGRGRRFRSPGYRPRLDVLESRIVLSFFPPTGYVAGSNPTATAVADFNSDGHADIVTVDSTSVDTVSVLLGNGDGTFQAAKSSAAGSTPTAVAVGDINGDGHPDLALTNATSTGVVSILMGNGDGTFQAPVSYTIGNNPTSVALADVNGDGHPDLITASAGAGTVSVLLNDGSGTFGPKTDYAAGPSISSLVVSDLNGDGHADIVAANHVSAGTVSVLLGNGDGTFQPATSYSSGSSPDSMHEGDFNDDGIPDIEFQNDYPGWVSVMRGRGDGSFDPPEIINHFASAESTEVGDFNGDGQQDIVERINTGVELQLGEGDGTFYPEVTYTFSGAPNGPVSKGDFNEDGHPDLAGATNTGAVSVAVNAANDVALLAGAVGFKLSVPATSNEGAAIPATVTAVDASGNPVLDFQGTVYFSTSDPAATSPSFAYTFTAADMGTHVFNDALSLWTPGEQTIMVSTPYMPPATATIAVSAGPATHFAVAAPVAPATAGTPITITVIAADTYNYTATSYTGTVHFTSTDVQAGLPADYTFTAADAGVHTFPVTLKTATPTNTYATVTVTDTATPTITGSRPAITVLPAAASSLSLSGGAGPIGVTRLVTVTARDPYGNVATSDSGTVQLTSSDPQAVGMGTGTLTAGIGQFPVKLMTVGTQTITATDVANPALNGTETVVADPPVASGFVVAGFPSTTAGAAQSFRVTVINTIGGVATDYTGTVSFSSSDVQAGLPAAYTFTAADAGVHTFTATLKTAGTQSITIRDFPTSFSGTQQGIQVTPAAAASLTVTGPGANLAGASSTLTVVARDAFGNVATAYTGTVSFSSRDAQAGLPASYTFTAADAGVHTVSVVLKTAGIQTVNVQDTANASILGNPASSNVIAAAATHVTISVPSNIVAGTAFSVKVMAVDAYGNEASGYRGTVHFSTSAASGVLPADYTFTAADNGVHTFSVTLSSTGTHSLTVTDVNNSLVMGTVSFSVGTGSGGGGGSGSGGGTSGGGTSGGGTSGGGSGGGKGGTA
jgi:hypothetical protein